MSGSVKRVAVRLALEGADQVRTQLTAVGNDGQRSLQSVQAAAAGSAAGLGNMRNALGQASFQIGDFASQVQGGTSALTALVQQGSQLLGAFGPAGAIAGAVLGVGGLAAALLTGRDNAEAFRLAEQSLGETFARNRDIIRELTGETQNLAVARANAGIAETQEQLGRARLAQDRLEQERAQIQRENELARRARGAVDQGLILQNQQRIDELNQRAQRAGEIADRIQEDLDRLSTLRQQFQAGEGLPTPPAFVSPPSDGGGGGGASRREAARGERELNQALRERDSLLRSLESPYDTYLRRLNELNELQRRLPEDQRLNDDQIQSQADRLLTDLQRAESGATQLNDIGRQIGLTFSSAFEDAIIRGQDFRTVVEGLIQDLARLAIRKAVIEPLANAAGSLIGSFFGPAGSAVGGAVGSAAAGGLKFADGGAFERGNVIPFASGGLVASPTFFPMSGGRTGLMGEAGPEAILPLGRDGSGRLGVRAQGGGGGINQVFNIDARGADAGVDQKIRMGIAIAVEQANNKMLAQINRGGSVAKAVGRRG